MNKRSALLAASVAAIMLVVPTAVDAVQYGGVGGHPAYPQAGNPRTKSIFIYQLKPGQTASDGLDVVNTTDQTQTIALDGVDSVISSGGAFACAQAADQKAGVGSWISLQSSSLTLAGNSNQIVPFSVNVPSNAGVGEHDGCITIQALSETSTPSNKSGVLLSFRSAIRVVVTIPGAIQKKLALLSVSVAPAKNHSYLVKPTAQNDGNVSLDSDVNVKLGSLLGTTSKAVGGTYPVLPYTKASWNLILNKPFWGGWYHALTSASYNSNPTAELGINQGSSQTVYLNSAWFFVPPSIWAALIYAVVIAALALGGMVIWRRQRDIKHIRNNWIGYTVKSSDTINSIAHLYGTNWQKLARVNRIKAPYNLHKGQQLKVPPKRKV